MKKVYTLGHSNRGLGEFLELLKYYNIVVVADVRRFPTSRLFPYFRRELLRMELPKHSVGYIWLGEKLGGYREGGYLRYMESEDFRKGIQELINIIELVRRGYVAIMCMEKYWFRCHRRFIANALVKMGYDVVHVIEVGKEFKHRYREYCSR